MASKGVDGFGLRRSTIRNGEEPVQSSQGEITFDYATSVKRCLKGKNSYMYNTFVSRK